MSTTHIETDSSENKVLPGDKTGLPWEIWQMILSWLSATDLCQIACVSKTWNELAISVDATRWKELYLSCSEWRHPFWPLNTHAEPPSWRLAYRDQYISTKFWCRRQKHEATDISCTVIFKRNNFRKSINVGPGFEHTGLKSALAVANNYDKIVIHPGIYDEMFEISTKVPFEFIGYGELGSVILVVAIQQAAMTARLSNLVLRAPWFTSFIVMINSGYLQVDNCILEDGMICAQNPSTVHIKFCTFRHATIILQHMNASVIENCEFSQSDSANIIVEGHPKDEKNWTHSFLSERTSAIYHQKRSLHRKKHGLHTTTSMTSTLHSSFTGKSLMTGLSNPIYDTISHDPSFSFDDAGASFLNPHLRGVRILGSDKDGMVGCGDLQSMYQEPTLGDQQGPTVGLATKDKRLNSISISTVSDSYRGESFSMEKEKFLAKKQQSRESLPFPDQVEIHSRQGKDLEFNLSVSPSFKTPQVETSKGVSSQREKRHNIRRKSLGSCSVENLDRDKLGHSSDTQLHLIGVDRRFSRSIKGDNTAPKVCTCEAMYSCDSGLSSDVKENVKKKPTKGSSSKKANRRRHADNPSEFQFDAASGQEDTRKHKEEKQEGGEDLKDGAHSITLYMPYSSIGDGHKISSLKLKSGRNRKLPSQFEGQHVGDVHPPTVVGDDNSQRDHREFAHKNHIDLAHRSRSVSDRSRESSYTYTEEKGDYGNEQKCDVENKIDSLLTSLDSDRKLASRTSSRKDRSDDCTTVKQGNLTAQKLSASSLPDSYSQLDVTKAAYHSDVTEENEEKDTEMSIQLSSESENQNYSDSPLAVSTARGSSKCPIHGLQYESKTHRGSSTTGPIHCKEIIGALLSEHNQSVHNFDVNAYRFHEDESVQYSHDNSNCTTKAESSDKLSGDNQNQGEQKSDSAILSEPNCTVCDNVESEMLEAVGRTDGWAGNNRTHDSICSSTLRNVPQSSRLPGYLIPDSVGSVRSQQMIDVEGGNSGVADHCHHHHDHHRQPQQQHPIDHQPGPLRRSQSEEILPDSEDDLSILDELETSDDSEDNGSDPVDSMDSTTDSSDVDSPNYSGSDNEFSSEESVIMLPHLREFHVDQPNRSTSPRGVEAEITSIKSDCTRPVPVNVSEDTLMSSYVGQIQGCLIHQCRMNHSKGGLMVSLQAHAVISECDISNVSYGIRCIQNSRVVILKNKIHHCRTSGIFMRLGSSGLIAGNDVHSNNEAGLDIRKNADPLVQFNQIHHGKRSGVVVLGSGRGQIKKNDIFGNNEAGVYVMYGGNPTISENYIYEGRAAGVAINAGGKGCIIDNVIKGNQWGGIDIRNGSCPLVSGNSIIDGMSDGVVVGVGGKGSIENNYISGNRGCGIWMMAAKHLYVHGNQICNSGHCGVMLLDKSASSMEHHLGQLITNVSHKTYSEYDEGQFVYPEPQAHWAVLQYNNIYHNKGQGIRIEIKDEVRLFYNAIHANQSDGIIMSQDAPILIEGNSVTSNAGSGIITSTHNKIRMVGNGVYDNGQHGLVCRNSCLVESNDVVGQVLSAIFVEGGASVQISNNRLCSSSVAAIKAEKSGAVMATNNRIFDRGGGDFNCAASFVAKDNVLIRPTVVTQSSKKQSKNDFHKTEFLTNPSPRPHITAPPPSTIIPAHHVTVVTKVSVPSRESCEQGSKLCLIL